MENHRISIIQDIGIPANDPSWKEGLRKGELIALLTQEQYKFLMNLLASIKNSGCPAKREIDAQKVVIRDWSDDDVVKFFVENGESLKSKPAFAMALIGRILNV